MKNTNTQTRFDHSITIVMIIFTLLLFSAFQLSAQEVEKDDKKTNETQSIESPNAPQVSSSEVVIKNFYGIPMIIITDENSGGSITLPILNSTGNITNKLYNFNGRLHWNGIDLIGTAARKIDDLSDAIYDGSSLFLGSDNGENNVGSDNTAVGHFSLHLNTTGNENTANGHSALKVNTSGSQNTANGAATLSSNTIGNHNTASGYAALNYNTSGNKNTANGDKSLNSNMTGSENTANGYWSLVSNTTGEGNTANGSTALYSNTTGHINLANGVKALYSNTTGGYNIGIGYEANYYNSGGSFNTIIGHGAGRGPSIHNKSGNIFLGYQAGYNETTSNKLYIENSNSTSPLIWGDFTNGSERVVINGNGTSGNAGYEFFVNGDAGGLTAWNNLSDERLKKNVSTITNALEKVNNLRGVNYEWIDSKRFSNGIQMGFIAQEADKVIPEVVDDSGEYFTMQYAPITALLVEAVKEQNEEFRTQNAELLKKIKKLEEENAESKIQNTEFSAQKKHLEERLSKLESLLEGNKFSSINK